MSNGTQKSNGERLNELLGFNAVKKNSISQDLFAKVVKEIKEARDKENEGKARELLMNAIKLQEQMDKTKKDFEAQCKKFDKDLGKQINQIQNMLSGTPPEEIADEEEKESAAS